MYFLLSNNKRQGEMTMNKWVNKEAAVCQWKTQLTSEQLSQGHHEPLQPLHCTFFVLACTLSMSMTYLLKYSLSHVVTHRLLPGH